MNKALINRLSYLLDDWMIRTIGMVDAYTYLIVADWDPKDNPKRKFETKSGKNFWSQIIYIDLLEMKATAFSLNGGLGKTYCDGGLINGKKEAFFNSYNGITYYMNNNGSLEPDGITIGKGSRGIRFIGKHFYNVYGTRGIYKRKSALDWELTSSNLRELSKKFGGRSTKAIDGFSEEDMYMCGDNGELAHYNGQKWQMIDAPTNFDFTHIICAKDGKVYIGGHRGELMVGRDNRWEILCLTKDIDETDINIMYSMVYFHGKIYGATRHRLLEWENDRWIEAKIEGIIDAEYLVVKDGIMMIGTEYSIKLYNGKEVQTLYGNDAYLDAMFIGTQPLCTKSA